MLYERKIWVTSRLFVVFFFLLGLHGYKETLEQFSVGEIDLKFPKFEIEHLLLTLE